MSSSLPNLSSYTVSQIVSDAYHKALYSVHGNAYVHYRQLWDQAISGAATLTHPLHIDLELLNSCNYSCSFCPYSIAPSKRPKGFDVVGNKQLDIGLIEKVLNEADGRLYAVELGYNTEPLLNTRILKIIAMCKQSGVLDIRMSTNGSLLENYDYNAIIESGLTQLQVSIDAVDNESYSLARQSDCYDKVVKSLNDFVIARDNAGSVLPRVRVTYVMTPENKHRAAYFKTQWENIADIIGFQDLMVYPDSGLDVSSAGLQRLEVDKYPGCYMPKVRMSIRSDGTVQPCCTVPGMRLHIGNIAKMSIETLWNSPAMQKIRSSHFDGTWTKNKICADCITNTYN